jgi:ABC-2 type transport system ATP-binding protein
MLAYIPDSPQLYEFLTGIKYLNFICDIFAIPYLIRQERIEKLANKFELLDALSNKIETYSRGMKQKIAIIAAFIHDFDVVVLDEPFMGLDPNAIFQLKALLKEYARMGKAILFSSHVLDVVEKICTRVVIINASELVVSNTISEISKRRINLEQLFLTVTKNA